ncbi:MAG: kelch repeat-containing protein [Thermoanaerobaculales bacterium]|jgi:hypothetical protein|nr:kelch repeat-containing protein [Thermoanaerobaculales bacterium]
MATLRFGFVVTMVVVLSGTLAATGWAVDHPGSWSLAETMPSASLGHGTAVVDGQLYVLGGFNFGGVIADVHRYDPATDTWETVSTMPVVRAGPVVASVDGLIYVIGGFDETGTIHGSVLIYDPATSAWSTGADMPTPRGDGAVGVAHYGLIYVVGGSDENGAVLQSVEVYDPSSDSWSTVADMSMPRVAAGIAVYNDEIWVSGGGFEPFVEPPWAVTAQVERFDPVTGTWSPAPYLNQARRDQAMVVLDDTLYVIGGFDSMLRGVNTERYIDDEGWVAAGAVPTFLAACRPATMGSKMYLPGGWVGIGNIGDTLLVYDPTRFTYWAEVAAHLGGAHGSLWRTDVAAANLGEESADVDLVLHSAETPGTMTASIPEGSQLALADVVGQMGVTGKGLLELSSDQPLRVTGRTFNDDGGVTFGQLCDLRTADGGLREGDTAYVVGLRQEGALFRTNLTFANTGIFPASIQVSLLANDGEPLDEYQLDLEPGASIQELEPFANRGGRPDLGWGFVTVDVLSGSGVMVSGSVIDSQSNDATTVYPKR